MALPQNHASNFTPAQCIIFTTCLCIVFTVLMQNFVILLTLGVTLYCTFRFVTLFTQKDAFYDSTCLLSMVDFIKFYIVKIEQHFTGVKRDPTEKLGIVAGSCPAEETGVMIDYIIRDFVQSWYKDLSCDPHLINESNELLLQLSDDMLHRAELIDKFSVIQKFADLFRLHLVDIQSSCEMLKRQPKFRRKKDRQHEFKMIESEEEAFRSLGKYHLALQDRTTELQYLRCITDSIMKVLFPSDSYQCYIGREFIDEILTCNVLMTFIDMVSQPHWLHKILILLLSDEDIIIVPNGEKHADRPSSHLSAAEDRQASSTSDNEITSVSGCDHISGEICTSRQTSNPASVEIPARDSSERLPPIGSSVTDDSPISNMLHAEPQQRQTSGMQRSTSMILPKQNVRPTSLRSHSTDDIPSMAARASIPSEHLAVPEEDTVSFRSWSTSSSASHDRVSQSDLEIQIDATSQRPTTSAFDSSHEEQEISGITEAEEAYSEQDDLVPIMRFIDVDVADVQVAKEAGGGSYTLYTIDYTSWHQVEGKWELKRGQVHRRYREFVTLHDRLEEHRVLKKFMKGVKGPQRWGIIPNTKVEGSKTDKRRHFLSEYLRSLIIKQEVCNSTALKEFLAYEGDGRIAFVRSAPDNLPRFDKMFFSTVKNISGVIDKISNVLPSLPDPHNVPTTEEIQRRRQKLAQVDISDWCDPHKLNLQFAHLMVGQDDVNCLTTVLKRCIDKFEKEGEDASPTSKDKADGTIPEEAEEKPKDTEEFYDTLGDDVLPKRNTHDKVSAKDEQAPLACILLELAVQTVQGMDTWVKQERTVNVAKVTIATFLDSFVRREIEDVTTKEYCTYYLRRLRDTLWPNGELDSEETVQPSEEQIFVTKNQARDAIKNFFPGWLPFVIGHEEYQHSINTVMDALQHEKINRHFAYKALDMLVEEVFPELSTANLRQQLLQNNSDHAEQDSENTSMESLP